MVRSRLKSPGGRVGASCAAALLAVLLLPGVNAVAAPFGNVLELDGIDDQAVTADSSSLDLGDTDGEDFTIEASIYVPDTSNVSLDDIFYKTGAYGLYVNFRTTDPDVIVFRLFYNSISYVQLLNTAEIGVGWHHVAGVYDNEWSAEFDRVAIYLDGAEFASNESFELTPGLYNSGNSLYVGANGGFAPFDGLIDEARISSSVRYSGAYTVPTSAFVDDASTRALWHFNEADGSTSFADTSGNGNTLTGQNGAQTTSQGGGPFFQPDAMVKRASAANFTGNDVYNTTSAGQSVSSNVAAGSTASFKVRVQNDGNTDDDISVKGCASSTGFVVTYLDGTTNVTTEVVAGSYSTGTLSPGSGETLTLKVKAKASTPSGAKKACKVVATSDGDGTKDAVKATAKVP